MDLFMILFRTTTVFLFFSFLWTGCIAFPFSLNSDQETIVLDEESYNYHETRTLSPQKTDILLASEGSEVSVRIQLPLHHRTQQSAFSRLGCQEIQFSFNSDFMLEGEQIPCQIA
ncbi:MAG: hypothetical protein AABZ60_23145, partial [Planctomycetota bacterium]